MTWLLLVVGAWLVIAVPAAIVICGGIKRRNQQVPYDLRQCPVTLEDGRRCKWYRTHPEAWGHSGWSSHD